MAKNRRWSIWHGPLDADGRPFELVLPIQGSAEERRAYLIKAIELLAALREETRERLIQRIINYDRDVLFVRNLDTDIEGTLPLDQAVHQVVGLQRVLLYAASAEHQPRPYTSDPPRVAEDLVHRCSFGHTLPGSFVFTVSTPRLPTERQAVQLELFPGGEDDESVQALARQLSRPFERRVSEQIARGLLLSRQARTSDYTALLDGYGEGFNANMCSAMVEVAAKGDAHSASFVVELASEDYQKAIDAHRQWKRVAVTGIPVRSAGGWRLASPDDFEIID